MHVNHVINQPTMQEETAEAAKCPNDANTKAQHRAPSSPNFHPRIFLYECLLSFHTSFAFRLSSVSRNTKNYNKKLQFCVVLYEHIGVKLDVWYSKMFVQVIDNASATVQKISITSCSFSYALSTSHWLQLRAIATTSARPSMGTQTTTEDTGTNPWQRRLHSMTDVCLYSHKFYDTFTCTLHCTLYTFNQLYIILTPVF